MEVIERRRILAAALLMAFATAGVHAQTSDPNGSTAQGGFPDASFSLGFRKYTPPDNDFSPFYSWDADMQLDVTLFRRGRGDVNVASVFQTVGTENLGKKVSVGGTGYLLSVGYRHAISNDLRVSAGVKHLSSHLTRDLDEKDAEVRRLGLPVPKVEDPAEYNVFFFELFRRFPSSPFKPDLDVILQSGNFRWYDDWLGFVRPVYLDGRLMLWERREKAILFETQQEFGKNWVSAYSLQFEFFRRGGDQGRFQIFIMASPGDHMHVSPIFGARRDGIAIGLRMRYQA